MTCTSHYLWWMPWVKCHSKLLTFGASKASLVLGKTKAGSSPTKEPVQDWSSRRFQGQLGTQMTPGQSDQFVITQDPSLVLSPGLTAPIIVLNYTGCPKAGSPLPWTSTPRAGNKGWVGRVGRAPFIGANPHLSDACWQELSQWFWSSSSQQMGCEKTSLSSQSSYE